MAQNHKAASENILAGNGGPGLSRAGLYSFALIAVTFLMTSSGYLSWLYHLLTLVPTQTADYLTMCAGYFLQAAGLLVCAMLIRRRPSFFNRNMFGAVCAAFIICMVPSMLSEQAVSVILFGLLMNVCCGLLAGYYLAILSSVSGTGRCGLIFGGGYAFSVLLSWLLSLIGNGSFLRSGYAVLLYIVLALAAFFLAVPKSAVPENTASEKAAPEKAVSEAAVPEKASPEEAVSGTAPSKQAGIPVLSRHLLFLVSATVFLMCTVKNMGFSFPSSDLGTGLSLEMSRLLYAAGLIIAGLVSDRSRKWGAVCTLAALITPFIMLTLTGEAVPHMILWCLDYLVFGFFSVYRVLVFSDLAVQNDLLFLSGFGLMFGRAGDAAGTLICLILREHVTVLILTAAGLFVITLILFLQMYQALYLPAAVKEKTERELFEQFAARHDLSAREREVLQQLIAGSTNAEIAQKLFVSESTVKFHVHNLLQKTGCQSRSQLRTLFSGYDGE